MKNGKTSKTRVPLQRKLASFRRMRGLTQRDVAEMVGTNRVQVGIVERGCSVTLENFLRIAEALQLEISLQEKN